MSKHCLTLSMESVDSTNEWVRNNIARLEKNTAVVTSRQTAGRGQGDHTWHSESGKNLLMTILLKENSLPAVEGFAVSAITALSMVELLDTYGIDAGIKLPNDIYVGGCKICGLLIEHSIRGEKIMWSMAGVGLNVNQSDFPSWIPNPTSMSILTSRTYDLDEILDRLLGIFFRRADCYMKNGDLDSLRSEFDSKCISFAK